MRGTVPHTAVNRAERSLTMNTKKFLSILLALAMTLVLGSCGGKPSTPSPGSAQPSGDGAAPTFEKMTWAANTAGAAGSNFAAGLEKFAELMAERTGGAVTVDVYTSDQLTNGSQTDSVQAVINGTIDLAFEADGIWGNFNDTFSVPQLPFLFSSYEDVDARLINGEGGKYMSDLLESSFSVKCLGIGENGFRYITNSKQPVKTPDDLKGLKIRVGGSPILTGSYDQWGADYTTTNWSEVYTGLQTKLYDGQENPVAVADASSIQEVQKYVTAWTAQYSCMFLTMNSALYNSLPDDLKAIVDECGKEACAYQVEFTRQQCEECLERWISEYGLELYEMSEENAQLFRELGAPVYEQFSQCQELIDLLSE